MRTIELLVNGEVHRVPGETDPTLLHVLRNVLDLKGTRFGCGQEECGACMVLVDGTPAYSCTMPVTDAAGKAITTVESLRDGDALHPLRAAFLDTQAGQCGYCLSGIMISAKAQLDANPDPSRAEIAAALDKNLRRCGAHTRIVDAVQRAGAMMRGA